jgi:hypothetical protein
MWPEGKWPDTVENNVIINDSAKLRNKIRVGDLRAGKKTCDSKKSIATSCVKSIAITMKTTVKNQDARKKRIG